MKPLYQRQRPESETRVRDQRQSRERDQSQRPESETRVRDQSQRPPESETRVRDQSQRPESETRVRDQSQTPESETRVRDQSQTPESETRETSKNSAIKPVLKVFIPTQQEHIKLHPYPQVLSAALLIGRNENLHP
ncbi:unnamed protein product [Knipowitschia caucasica]